MENLSLYFTAASEYRTPPPLDSIHIQRNSGQRPTPSFLNNSKTVISTVSLIAGGEDKLVTDKNKSSYVQLMVRHCIDGRFGVQARAVREGIMSVLPEPCLSLFNDRDLDLLVSGCTSVCLADWRAHTVSQVMSC